MRSAAWDSSSITYYLDGRLYHTVNSSSALLPTSAMHVIFDQVPPPYVHCTRQLTQRAQAVDPLLFPPHGGDDGAYKGDGVSMRVAWVRAFKRA